MHPDRHIVKYIKYYYKKPRHVLYYKLVTIYPYRNYIVH